MNSSFTDTEYLILEKVYDSAESQSPLRQRDLAQMAGTSLGMTNVILKRLARKGWITIKNVFFYKEKIDQAIGDAKRRGAVSALLVGQSDLDFIVEYSCHRHGLQFLQVPDRDSAPPMDDTTLHVYAEAIPPAGKQPAGNVLLLSRMVLEQTPGLISAVVLR
jgi:hypothetical protein